MKVVFMFALLLVAGRAFPQLRFDISKIKKTEVTGFSKTQDDKVVYIETKYGGYDLKYNADDIKELGTKIIKKVQYVYTDYPPNFDYTDLDFQRFAALYLLLPEVFNKPWIQWEIVKQTKCSSVHEASTMFHGFVITIKEGPAPNAVLALPQDVQKKLDSISSSVELVDVSSSEDIVKFLSSKSVKITNVKYPKKSLGLKLFKQKDNGSFNIVKGLFLTTGIPQGATGPNNSPSVTSVNGMALTPDKNLEGLVGKGSPLFDLSIVEFDVQVDADSLIFKYAFASEEYPEFLQFNDVFGLFISGVGLNNVDSYKTLNLANLPDGKTPISVSSINHLKNQQYFIANDYDKDLKLFKVWQFDGFTKVMTAKVKVKRNEKYHIKFAIADYGDPFYDSAIFIDAFGVKAK